MLLRNIGVLFGRDLRYVAGTSVRIGERFECVKKDIRPEAGEESVDCEGMLLMPGMVNAHTHVGDSIAKDVTLNGSARKRIHPVSGAKAKILKNTSPGHLASYMRNSSKSMVARGTTTFVDFREGGMEGVLLLKRALRGLPIRRVILGRAESYQDVRRIKKNEGVSQKTISELGGILGECDGLGVSGANENSDSVLKSYSRCGGLRAIHASETAEGVSTSARNYKRSETVRALQLRPHFVVHMTHASRADLGLAAKKTRGIVVCPRANAALAEGIPDVGLMMKCGCNVAIGTDNVMINSPDMFREMDYLWKASMAVHKKRISPADVLKMATVNAGKMLGMDVGVIEAGKLADCVFIDRHSIDLDPIHDVHASIVHRASESAVRAVMIGGRIIHGRL